MRHIRTLAGIMGLLALAPSAVADAPRRAAADPVCSLTGGACPVPCEPCPQSCPVPCTGMATAQVEQDAEMASH